VNDDCLKLTTYFGERDRTGGRLLADALFDIYGAHRVQTSVLLRGAEGFGRLHHLHTDRLLSLSEDLPVVSIAVDTRPRIESMLEAVMQIKRRGLVTLERARLVSGELGAPPAGGALDPATGVVLPDELGKETKLTVYVGRQQRVDGRPAFVAVCDLLYRRGVAGATVLLGVDGTSRGRRTRARFFARNSDVPMMIIGVGTAERVADVLPELSGLLRDPILTLERVRLCKRSGELLARPHELPGTDEHGIAVWQKLMVYSSDSATWHGRPLHLEIIRRLRASDAAGATSLRGIWGFRGTRPPRGDKVFQVRRHVPVVTVVIDAPERIARSFAIIDEVTREHGMVTSEMVPAMTAISAHDTLGDLRIARHDY
jgi:PII-like signaling protein